MNEHKLSAEEVPPKFAEWLLAMGCPPEVVPPPEKMSEMCRGQYYMVWRSLMEHVGPKDKILNKRLQVFNDDVQKCQKKNVFNELDVNKPKELALWQEHTELKEKVADAEARVMEHRKNLNQLMDKVSSKLAQRDLSRKRLEDAQRRSWLLEHVSAKLRERRARLLEAKDVANSLCCLDDTQDVESKIDRCLSAISRSSTSRATVSQLSVANPAASSSIASTNDDAEEQIASLEKCRGDVVFKQLFERRAGLCVMPTANDSAKKKDRRTPKSVLAQTETLHCTLALEAVKNRALVQQTVKRIANSLDELNNHLTGESCDLLMLRCEKAHIAARAKALRMLIDELKTRSGVFANAGSESDVASTSLHNVDKAILSKKDEIMRLIISAAAVERKTQYVRDLLTAIFNSFHGDKRFQDQTSIANSTQEPMSSLRQFYEEWREKRKNKMDLSMDLDVSGSCSYNDLTENGSPKFIDELKFYLKKFSLEKNRKLVLESGENIWIFETVQSSLNRLLSQWQKDDITTSLVCPSVSLAHNLGRLAEEMAAKAELEALVRSLEGGKKQEFSIDISSITEEEQKTLEKVKKQLNDNIVNLQKTVKTLDLGIENLNIWSSNNMKRYISENRNVDGRNYKEYESAFLEALRL